MGKKFLFEQCFDSADGLAPQRFSADEVKGARDVAFAAGREAGLGEARSLLEHQMAGTLATMAECTARLIEQRTADAARIERDALALGTAVFKRLFPEMDRRHGATEIEALVRDALRNTIEEPRVVIRVSNPVLDGLRPRLEEAARAAGFAGRLVLIGEETMGPGDCRVEWADGGAERAGNRLWNDIDAAIRRVVDAYPAPAGGAAAA